MYLNLLDKSIFLKFVELIKFFKQINEIFIEIEVVEKIFKISHSDKNIYSLLSIYLQ